MNAPANWGNGSRLKSASINRATISDISWELNMPPVVTRRNASRSCSSILLSTAFMGRAFVGGRSISRERFSHLHSGKIEMFLSSEFVADIVHDRTYQRGSTQGAA